jgi:hypothetical protein
MSTFADAATFANDPELVAPLTAAVVSTAVSIMNEDPTSPHHRLRANTAFELLRNPSFAGTQWNWAVSSNGTVVAKWLGGDKDGAISDLAYVLSTIWNAMSGVTGLE